MTSNGISETPSKRGKPKLAMILGITAAVLGLVTYVVNDRKLADLKGRVGEINDARASLAAFYADDTQKVESYMKSPEGTTGEDRIERLNRFMVGTGDAEVMAVKSFLKRVPAELPSMSFFGISDRYQRARDGVIANAPVADSDLNSFEKATEANGRLQRAQGDVRDYINTLMKDADRASESGEAAYEMWKKVSLVVVLLGTGLAVVTVFIGKKDSPSAG